MPLFDAIPAPRQVFSAARRMMVPATRPVTREQVPGEVNDVLVIGAGLSGLAAACRLQAAGKQVTVVEAEAEVGGRCRTERLSNEHGEFLADTGATVLTMPELIDNLLLALNVPAEDVGWGYRKLRPAYHAMFASGRHLDVYSDEDRMAREVRKFAAAKHGKASPEVAAIEEGYRQHRRWAAEIFKASFESFIGADFDSMLDAIATPATANDMARLVELGAFGSLGKTVQRNLGDAEIARVFSFQALYAGMAPARARAVYGVISHMDTSMGVYYPLHGMGDVTSVLARALEQAGGTVLCHARVDEVTHDGVRAGGVLLESGEQLRADAIIATPDLPVVQKLLGVSTPLEGKFPTWSPSAVVLHGTVPTAVSAAWPSADSGAQQGGYHHNISFGHHWEETFEQLTARSGARLMEDPSLLITRPAISCPERRITGADGQPHEPVSILAPTPNLERAKVDWGRMAENYGLEVLKTLEARGFTGIADGFSLGRIDTPVDWAAQGHGAGTPFGLAHTVAQTGPFRPRNYPAAGLNNVILAGSSTTPGVGVPTTLLSGGLAARRIIGGGSIR